MVACRFIGGVQESCRECVEGRYTTGRLPGCIWDQWPQRPHRSTTFSDLVGNFQRRASALNVAMLNAVQI